MGAAYNTDGEVRNACKIVIEKTEEKMSLVRPRIVWDNTIKKDLTYVCVDWILVAQDKDWWRSLVNNNEPLISLLALPHCNLRTFILVRFVNCNECVSLYVTGRPSSK
jgi:hypothetical protein